MGINPVETIIDTYAGSKWEKNKVAGFDKGWTLVLTFSRPWCVEPFFDNFVQMEMDLNSCHLLVIDNTVLPRLTDLLKGKLELMKECFRSVRLIKTWEHMGGPIRPLPRQMVKEAASEKVYYLQCEMIKHVHTRKFALIEDDTLPCKTAIHRLMDMLKKDSSIGIATAVEPTRTTEQYVPLRLGVHYIKADGMRLLERLSLPNRVTGYCEVDACGWYCFASYTKLWKESLKGMNKFFDIIPHFACDTMHTYRIKKMGYKIVANFGISCAHLATDSRNIYFCRKDRALPMIDIYVPQYDLYFPGHLVDWDKRTLEYWGLNHDEAVGKGRVPKECRCVAVEAS
jgi:hypothetical protein